MRQLKWMKYEKELKNCLAVLKHMGIARTRGFGEIKATLEVQAEKIIL